MNLDNREHIKGSFVNRDADAPIQILYMEDNPGQARLFQKKMTRLGYEVEIAPDGKCGLERIQEAPFDMLVLDHDMPFYDGMQVLQQLSQKQLLPPAVMLTGTGNEALAVEAMKQGAEDYLVKDVDGLYLELLPSVLQNLMRNKRIRDERTAANEALARSEQRFRAMFENAPIGMILCDKDACTLRVNDALCEQLRQPREALLDVDICSALSMSMSSDALVDALLRQAFRPVEISYQRGKNERIWLEVTGTYFTNPSGMPRLWLFVEDITQRKAMFEELIQSSKLRAVGELAANIAHEINNPLGIISAKARLLLTHEADNMSSKVQRELGKMIEQCDRLGRLTRGLLDYARPSLRNQVEVELQKPLEQAVHLIRHRTKERGMSLDYTPCEQRFLVQGNSQELEQVFLNLLLNAVEATPKGGCVSVNIERLDGTDTEPERVVVHVSDNGEGIEDDVLPHIFEPFYTTKEEGRGTGLGLAICFGLLRSHRGTIKVQSAKGEGTTFSVYLPVMALP